MTCSTIPSNTAFACIMDTPYKQYKLSNGSNLSKIFEQNPSAGTVYYKILNLILLSKGLLRVNCSYFLASALRSSGV